MTNETYVQKGVPKSVANIAINNEDSILLKFNLIKLTYIDNKTLSASYLLRGGYMDYIIYYL